MDALPKELVGIVFGCLRASDVSRARAACRKFSKSKALWRKLRLELTERNITNALLTCAPAFVQELDLGHDLRGSSVARVHGFPNLQRLEARCCISRLADSLAGLPHLTHLDLKRCLVFDKDLFAVAPLRHLVIEPSHDITDKGLVAISRMAKLEFLGLTHLSNCTPQGTTEMLGQLTSLKQLHLPYVQCFIDSHLEKVACMVDLHTLNLTKCENLTGAGLVHLQSLKHLEDLHLSRCSRLTSSTLEHVGQLLSLTSLHLIFCPAVTNTGMVHLAQLKNLRKLLLFGCQKVGDDGCASLRALTNLEFLSLGATKITDAGLAHVATLLNLRLLDLADVNITDEGVASLARLVNLEDLNLTDCNNLTDLSLTYLGSLPKLEVLDVRDCHLLSQSALASVEQKINCVHY